MINRLRSVCRCLEPRSNRTSLTPIVADLYRTMQRELLLDTPALTQRQDIDGICQSMLICIDLVLTFMPIQAKLVQPEEPHETHRDAT